MCNRYQNPSGKMGTSRKKDRVLSTTCNPCASEFVNKCSAKGLSERQAETTFLSCIIRAKFSTLVCNFCHHQNNVSRYLYLFFADYWTSKQKKKKFISFYQQGYFFKFPKLAKHVELLTWETIVYLFRRCSIWHREGHVRCLWKGLGLSHRKARTSY